MVSYPAWRRIPWSLTPFWNSGQNWLTSAEYCVGAQHMLPGHSGSHGTPASDSELADETSTSRGRVSPRLSLATAADDDTLLMPKQRKSSKFNIGPCVSFQATEPGFIFMSTLLSRFNEVGLKRRVRRASFIDLHLHAKFNWNRRNFLWTDGRTDGRTYGRTSVRPQNVSSILMKFGT